MSKFDGKVKNIMLRFANLFKTEVPYSGLEQEAIKNKKEAMNDEINVVQQSSTELLKLYVNSFSTLLTIPNNKITLQDLYNLKVNACIPTIEEIFQEENILKHQILIQDTDNQCEIPASVNYRDINVNTFISYAIVLYKEGTCNDYIYTYELKKTVGDSISYCLDMEETLKNFEPLIENVNISYLYSEYGSYFFRVTGDIYIQELPDIQVSPTLSQVINTILGRNLDSPLTEEELNSISTIHAYNVGTQNLEGLEYAGNILNIYAGDNDINSLSNISQLVQLEELDIEKNNLDLGESENLRDLVNLKFLNISSTGISELNNLANLINLNILYMYNNEINSLDALSNMTKLTKLLAENNLITSISGLSNLTNLVHLILFKNLINDISPLKQLTNLKILDLSYNNISDVRDLKDLTNLESLELSKNQIYDLSSLSNLTNLSYFDAKYQVINFEEVNIGSETSYTFQLSKIKNIDGSSPQVIKDISHNGIYDVNTNTITWDSINNSITISFNFEASDGFTGSVSQIINK